MPSKEHGGELVPTMEDIAKELGVSKSTVSKALNGAKDVSKAMRQTVLEKAVEMGYSRAARIVDEMEEKGIVGPFQGSKPREILITKEQWAAMRGEQPQQMEMDDLPFDEIPAETPVTEAVDAAVEEAWPLPGYLIIDYQGYSRSITLDGTYGSDVTVVETEAFAENVVTVSSGAGILIVTDANGDGNSDCFVLTICKYYEFF